MSDLALLLRKVFPTCREPDAWAAALAPAAAKYDLGAREVLAAFLAQVAVESQELNRVAEDLNYSAARLVEVWPRRFPSLVFASQYAGNPQKLGSFVYSSRLGNGPESSGDGWVFRGRGLIQLTGRANYRKCGLALGLPLEAKPDLLCEKPVAAMAAGWFWSSRQLNPLAIEAVDDSDDEDFRIITRRVNGGEEGLARRERYLETILAHLE